MKVYYTIDYPGIYPVGSCIIAVAEDKKHAKSMMKKSAENAGMPICNKFEILELSIGMPQAKVLLNGDY